MSKQNNNKKPDAEDEKSLLEALGEQVLDKQNEETRARAAAFEDARVKHFDFVIDLQNKLARIILGFATAALVFLGWIYRDLSTGRGVSYNHAELVFIGILVSLSIIAAALLTWSNFIISKRQEDEKRRDLIDQEIREAGSNVPKFQKTQEKEFRKLDNTLNRYDKSEPKIKRWGIGVFAAAILVGVVPLMFTVWGKISENHRAGEPLSQESPVDNPDQHQLVIE